MVIVFCYHNCLINKNFYTFENKLIRTIFQLIWCSKYKKIWRERIVNNFCFTCNDWEHLAVFNWRMSIVYWSASIISAEKRSIFIPVFPESFHCGHPCNFANNPRLSNFIFGTVSCSQSWLWLKHFSEELIKRGHEVNKCAYYIIDVQLNDFFVNFRSQQSQIIRQPYQILITPKS